jgi:hypothetical protein
MADPTRPRPWGACRATWYLRCLRRQWARGQEASGGIAGSGPRAPDLESPAAGLPTPTRTIQKPRCERWATEHRENRLRTSPVDTQLRPTKIPLVCHLHRPTRKMAFRVAQRHLGLGAGGVPLDPKSASGWPPSGLPLAVGSAFRASKVSASTSRAALPSADSSMPFSRLQRTRISFFERT